MQDVKTRLVEGLTKGEGGFVGFHGLFRVPLSFEGERSISLENAQEISQASTGLSTQDLDLIFVLTSRRNSPLYQACKGELLGNGVPNQVVIGEKLGDPNQRPWVLENVALAIYAKVGGTPWVVANPMKRQQLVLGVSRVQDINRRFLVGFVTLFTQDGDFLLMHSKAPVFGWEEYVEGLTRLISEALEEYRKLRDVPDSIVVHLHKRPGYRELEAIQGALDGLQEQIPYALLHLNEYSSFRLFDTSHLTYIPVSSLKVDLGYHQALLLLDGRVGNQRRKVGVPRVLDIAMDKRSTLAVEEFPNLVRQIHDFARVNWRGFNAAAIPVTVNYARLIARLVLEVGTDHWNQIIAAGKLREKAWFL
ncbi:MAG: hypothetical protein M1136_01290 [Chloroflexi bacterium]|nr:hypothetical protein [Chloroflexota bacterium]